MKESAHDQSIQVLLVEDDRRVRGHIRDLVESLNRSSDVTIPIAMECVATVRECLDHLADFFVDVVLLDLSLPDVHGIGAITQVSQSCPQIPIVVLTNTSGWASMVQCAEAGGRDYLIKNELDADMLFRSLYYAYERKQVEDRLKQSQALYQSLVDHLPVGVFRKDARGRYEYVNKAFCDAVGYDAKQIRRRGDGDLFCDADAESLHAEEQEMLRSRQSRELEAGLTTAQGKQFEAQWVKLPVFDLEEEEVCGIQGVLCDVTERKRVEDQRRLAERFAGMEALAGQIAHHVNNRLAPVMLNASIIESRSQDPELVEASRKIGDAAARAGQVVRHLLALAQQSGGRMMPIEVDLLLQDLPRYVREAHSDQCRVDLRMASNISDIQGDFSSLKEVLEQLCVNACEATDNEGLITVTAERASAVLDADTQESIEAVAIRVRDQGPGIPEENRHRVFDPYFTTKDPDLHQGVGLARGMSVARQHGGQLRVVSDQERGACLELLLPAIVRKAIEAETPALGGGEAIPIEGGTVLLVDDEEAILEAAQVILEGNGFEVMTASDGAQAIAKFSEHAGEINVVVTDLMMPYMDGAMLSKAIRDISPSVPIFVATGLDSQENLDKLTGLGVREVIPKPFVPKDLVRRLREELASV